MSWVRRVGTFFAYLTFVLAFFVPAFGQVDVLMRHNDQGQTGANNAETILNNTNVGSSGFGLRFAFPVKGDLYAQVLVLSGANISGHRNVGLAATGHNMVYAFDADTGVEIWNAFLGPTVPQQSNNDIPFEIGIVGTPVVEASTKTLYVVAKTLENGKTILRLHALDIANRGVETFGAPIEIYAFVPGAGDGGSNGAVFFDAENENQRPGLKLFNGTLYIAFASHEDRTPYHGWVLAYDAHNLRPDPFNLYQLPKAAFNTTPNAGGGGIWMSGQAPVIDSSGNVYALTGNLILVDPTTDCPNLQHAGNADTESDPTSYGESYIKLSGNLLAPLGFFKPPNAHQLDCDDSDVSSGGAMEIPGAGYIVGGGKDGRLFVINEDSNLMGGYHPTVPLPNDPSKIFDVHGGLIFSSPVWFDSLQRIYLWGSGTELKAWNWSQAIGGFLNTDNPLTATTRNPAPPTTPNGYSANAELAISSNGGAPGTGLVWALAPTTNPNDPSSGGTGNLYAFDAGSLDVLYHDFYGNYAKYNVPTVANGKVYVPTFTYDKTNRLGNIAVYGFPPKRRAVRPLSDSAMAQQTYTFSTVDSSDPNVEIPVNLNFAGDLAPGMSFFGSTGVLTGTPATPGVFDFSVTAHYSDGTPLPQEYALSVCQSDPASPNLAVNIPINSSYVIGTINSNLSRIYSFDLVSAGLPPGMVLDRNTGMVSGAPTVAGTYNARIRSTRLQDPNVSLYSCAAGTTSDLFYQISVTCPGGQCQFEGYHDGLDSDNIWGWAWNRTQPFTPVQVDIYDSSADVVPAGTPPLARVTANLFRQDLLNAGKGDGNHAFVFPVPGSLRDGQTHRIHVTFAGTLQDLGWSPRSFASARFVGTHSSNACDRIDGFAVDNWQPNVPIDVDIFDNGLLLASLVANYDGSTVAATAGHGTHGFLYFTPDSLKDGSLHRITVTFKLSGGQLANTNQTLSCAAAPPVSNPNWEGWFDSVTCDRVDGWGWDTNRPNTPIDMALFADGVRVATLTANYFSQDLVNAGKGNGAHRYLYYFPDFLKDGMQHHVTAQIVGQNTDLPISSSSNTGFITCGALPVPAGPPPQPVTNTPTGSGVVVSSGQPSGAIPGVDVSFGSVSTAGTTSFVSLDVANLGQLPDNYAFPHAPINPLAFEISTTAGYTGPVGVTFHIPSETDAAEFSMLRILHRENGAWVDRTVLSPDPQSPSFGSHTLTARVDSFSPFVLARLIQSPFNATVNISASGNSIYGQNVVFTVTVSQSNGPTPTGTITFTDGGQLLSSASLDAYAQASVNTALLAAGPHLITAAYSGDSVFPPGSARFNQTVSPAALLVSANPTTRPYGSANPFLAGTVSGLQNNDSITATFQSTALAQSPAGTTHPITITLFDPNGRLGNYSVSQMQGTLTVAPAVLTVTANSKNRMYGDANPPWDGVVSGVANNDGITASFSCSASPASPVGAYAITPTVSDPNGKLGNYSLYNVNGTLLVIPAVLTARANDKTRVYGAANPALDGTVTGARNGDSFQAQFSTVAVAGSSVGAYPIFPTLSDPGGLLGNYNIVVQNGVLSVTPASLSVSINPATRLYGDPNPAFTGTISGLLNNDNITAAYQSSANATSGVGTYSITAAFSDPGGRLGNYSVSQASGTLTVQAVPLNVTANNKTRMYGDPNPPLDGTVTGLRNGDDIQVQYSTTATAQSLLGNYPIIPALSDPTGKLGNYVVTLQSGLLTVTRSNISLALPNFNPPSGTYSLGQTVAISDATSSAAAIHYTVDGTTPTASSPLYTGPIVLNAPTTLQAMATQPEYADSGVALANYIVQIPISVTPATQDVSGCGSTSYSVAVPALNGLSGTLALSVSGLPAGATASFSPAVIGSPGSSTLTVTTFSATPPGNYPFSIIVTNGALSGNTTARVKIKACK